VLEEAWRVGVRLFDTAPHYGLGLSERRLGDFLVTRPRDEVRVSTKVGRRLVTQPNPTGAFDDEGFLVPADSRRTWDFSRDGVRRCVEESLERMRLDRLDTAYLHDPERWDLDVALAQGLPALAELKEQGLVGSIGVGSMDGAALLAAARTGQVDELMVAGRYTLVDQAASEELLPLCAEQEISVVAAAVFNGGLLAGALDASSTYDYGDVPPAVMRRAQEMQHVCAEAVIPLAAAALQFPLRHPAVRSVVVGAVEPGQVEVNARLMSVTIPEELWARLDHRTGVWP
jgi:D-threo-aldose 1-dehydrogenase